MRIGRRLLALAMAVLPVGVSAQTVPMPKPDPALTARAQGLVAMLGSDGDHATYFAPTFRAAVPKAKWDGIAAQLVETLGKPVKVETVTASTPFSGDVVVGYERGSASVRLTLNPAPPHAVAGLLITGTTLRDDSLVKLDVEFRALPGASGFGLYALNEAAPVAMAEVRADAAAPIGSAFKLWVLAEVVRQVNAGTRRWDEVVRLGQPSLPSGVLQNWPAGSPLTLQTLATLMISISDNSATDTLMTVLGRGAVDARALANGGTAPVLTTREFFALKSDPALTAAWRAGDTATRVRLLQTNAVRFAGMVLDPHVFDTGPVATDSVEWFASPRAMAGLLDTLRRDPVARAILGINPGIDPAAASRLGYVGFKGGSEPGVIALNLVVQAKDGRWYAATGSWHRTDGAVNELRFVGLMTRALALVTKR